MEIKATEVATAHAVTSQHLNGACSNISKRYAPIDQVREEFSSSSVLASLQDNAALVQGQIEAITCRLQGLVPSRPGSVNHDLPADHGGIPLQFQVHTPPIVERSPNLLDLQLNLQPQQPTDPMAAGNDAWSQFMGTGVNPMPRTAPQCMPERPTSWTGAAHAGGSDQAPLGHRSGVGFAVPPHVTSPALSLPSYLQSPFLSPPPRQPVRP